MNLPPIIEQPIAVEEKDDVVRLDAKNAVACPLKRAYPKNAVVESGLHESGLHYLGVKKIVICITRDVDPAELAILHSYGKVLEYDHDCHNNLPANLFKWEYLIIDLRESGDRYFLAKQIYPNRAKYAIVAYHYAFEFNVLDDLDNEFTAFPKKQGLREDYESLLMTRRIEKPRWYLSLFTCLFNVYSGIKK